MKAKRKSNKVIFISVIAITLYSVTFWFGSHYTGSRSKAADSTAMDGSNSTDSTSTIKLSPITEPINQTDTPVNREDTPKYNSAVVSDNSVTSTPTDNSVDSIIYSNSEYGFDFKLPASWKGYTIQTQDWNGMAVSGDNAGNVVETGNVILIRHPEWTEINPRQDIPIMVFTIDQWNKVEKEDIALGAAPIGPSKLGCNSKYIFALPARYNFAFPTGFEEVEKIMNNNPLTPNEDFK
jgi:hypothetical protein